VKFLGAPSDLTVEPMRQSVPASRIKREKTRICKIKIAKNDISAKTIFNKSTIDFPN